MELSERCIQTLEKEGFARVYEESYPAGQALPERSFETKVSIFVTEGTYTITVKDKTQVLQAGDRLNIPPNTPYSAVVGLAGCQLVMGEMGDGDF